MLKEECYWFKGVPAPSFSLNRLPDSVDVVIVGGGIAGLSSAYHLQKAGKSVLVLEKNRVGRGASGRNTGMLVLESAATYHDLEREYGYKKARRVFDSLAYALDQLEETINSEKLLCDFERTSTITVANGVASKLEIRNDYEARKRLRMSVEWVEQDILSDYLPMVRAESTMKMPGEATVHPYKLIIELARKVHKCGGFIAENVEYKKHKVSDDGIKVITSDGDVRAGDIIFASESDLSYHHKNSAPADHVFMTVVVTEPIHIMRGWNEREMLANSYPLFEYARLLSDHRIMFSSGRTARLALEWNDHDVKAFMQRAFDEFFKLPTVNFDYIWHGHLAFSPELLPCIGSIGPHEYVAGRYNGHGLMFGFLAGELLARKIQNKPHPYHDLFDITSRGGFLGRAHRKLPKACRHVISQSHLDKLKRQDNKMRKSDDYWRRTHEI